MTRHWILLFGAIVFSASRSAAAAERCGIAIAVPHHWKVSAEKQIGDACEFALDPPRWAKIQRESDVEMAEHAIRVSVSSTPFADAARRAGLVTVATEREEDANACPDLSQDTWLLRGGKGTGRCNAASVVLGPEFEGVAGDASYGLMNKQGGYAGLGEYEMAIVTNHRVTVRLDGIFVPPGDGFVEIAQSIIAKSAKRPN